MAIATHTPPPAPVRSKKNKKPVTNPDKPPVDQVRLEVRAVPCWRSADGELLGWFPALIGPEYHWGFHGFLTTALAGIDPWRIDPQRLYASEAEAMHAWEQAQPLAFNHAEFAHANTVGAALADQITQRRLYRKVSENLPQN